MGTCAPGAASLASASCSGLPPCPVSVCLCVSVDLSSEEVCVLGQVSSVWSLHCLSVGRVGGCPGRSGGRLEGTGDSQAGALGGCHSPCPGAEAGRPISGPEVQALGTLSRVCL